MDAKKLEHWNVVFKDAHLNSSKPHGLAIQRAKPPNGRSIYNEDKDEISEASRNHNYKIVLNSPKVVFFILNNK